jgi:OOP family OmpA-OmpF porin
LKKGRPAPEIRDLQRQNFKFEPIYFDYAKAEIRPEYKAFLLEMVEIIDGHSDLRIKVVGNTDSDGSDKYNERLSMQRAKSIISFFVANGLSADRIVLEFNGEKKPADRNDTEEGKQRNRRVEFEFI